MTSAAVLRNRGVEVVIGLTVAAHEVRDGKPFTRWVLERGPEDMPKTTSVFVRFDLQVIADLEERFGSSKAFLSALNVQPWPTIRTVLALMLERDERDVGRALLVERADEYARGVMVAWGLASGLDPQRAVEILEMPLVELVAAIEQTTD
jgi:hypothetical protein